MRKILIIVIVVGAALWGIDAYYRHWTSQRLEQTIRYQYPNTKVTVNFGGYLFKQGGHNYIAKPVFPSLLFFHKVKDVNIHMSGDLHMGTLSVDDFTFTTDSLSLDNTQFFDSKRTVVRETSGGAVQMRISDSSLSVLKPDLHIIIDGSDNATANVGDTREPLVVTVTDTSIDFAAGSETLGSISTVNNPFLPCKPEKSFGAHALYLSCPTPKPPGAVTGKPS